MAAHYDEKYLLYSKRVGVWLDPTMRVNNIPLDQLRKDEYYSAMYIACWLNLHLR